MSLKKKRNYHPVAIKPKALRWSAQAFLLFFDVRVGSVGRFDDKQLAINAKPQK